MTILSKRDRPSSSLPLRVGMWALSLMLASTIVHGVGAVPMSGGVALFTIEQVDLPPTVTLPLPEDTSTSERRTLAVAENDHPAYRPVSLIGVDLLVGLLGIIVGIVVIAIHTAQLRDRWTARSQKPATAGSPCSRRLKDCSGTDNCIIAKLHEVLAEARALDGALARCEPTT